MNPKNVMDKLLNSPKAPLYLMLAATAMLFTMLGAREIWTQEHRWADIVTGMFYRHDFLHPYLGEVDYYDKPLLSYWLIAAISFVTGHVSTWALRLPSALAGLLSVWTIYRLGLKIENRRLGLLAGWMLLTTFYFIFWARTSSADMLNMAGSLFAVYWYLEKREQPSFYNYSIFFIVLALTCLCKGLIGAIVPLMVIFPDLLLSGWKRHLRLSFFLAMIPAALIYVFPFWASDHFGGNNYGQSGLYLVYRENILRYFQPFDHKGPIYTYFLFLPIYMLPWAIFFIPAVFSLKSRWKTMVPGVKWMCWSVLLVFLFLTFSGSRRNYYILPVVPFAILMTADWILANTNLFARRYKAAAQTLLVAFTFLFFAYALIQPFYYSQGGMEVFAKQLKADATAKLPWSDWEFTLLDPESKIKFYLQLPPTVKEYPVTGRYERSATPEVLMASWPMLQQKPAANTIFISRKMYQPYLEKILTNYHVVEAKSSLGEKVLKIKNLNAPIAFVPND